jgi:acyl-CoA thioester hydrolase
LAITVAITATLVAIVIASRAVRRAAGGSPSESSGRIVARLVMRANLTEACFRNKVRRTMSKPVIEIEDMVRPEWIDSNGHMNLAYYVVVFDIGTDALYDALDIGNAYRARTSFSCFTAETHTLYERELHLGEKLRVRSWLLGADTKRVHYVHEMFHAESGERSCLQELMALHIDMRIRRVAPFEADKHEAMQALVRQYAPMELPKGCGRRIALPGR